jgi:beta-glucosidase
MAPSVSAVSRRALLGGLLAGALITAPRRPRAHQANDKEKVDELVARMTLEEKVGQLTLLDDPFRLRPGNINPEGLSLNERSIADEIRAGRIGALLNGVGAAQARYAQELAVNESRLSIPLLFAADIVHGLRTIFPVPLGEAASWDPDLAERTARAAAAEGAASGIHQTYAPMVDVARDQRWGRVVEGAGEDLLLNTVFAAARTRGFQGRDLRDPMSLLATPKHFAAYSAAEGGMEYNTTDMSERTLREVYLPPFKAAFDAGALSTMSGFNDLNGVPTSGNRWLLTHILRDEWRFPGFVVSDYKSEKELVDHGFAEDERDAARIAMLAGVDMSMNSGIYRAYLPGLVESGEVPVERLDQAVRRVLSTKAALGLFENPWRGLDAEQERRIVGSRAHRELAREAGRKSAVLLKNDGGILPLPKSGCRIALIGPYGADPRHVFGPWSVFADGSMAVTVEQGFRAAMADPSLLTVVKGSDAEAALPGGIEAAVAAAGEADVVVLTVGEQTLMSGEAQSRVTIDVPAPQRALAEAVAAIGKPMVVLLKTGRALELSGAVKQADAIMVTWFLGSEEGNAVADLVFGDHGPVGRLPVSFPYFSGQQPYYYNRKTTGRPETPQFQNFTARYREAPNAALYPFGHGLGYAPVVYENLRLSSDILPWEGELTATVSVVNQGRRPVEETVQLYIRDRVASVTRPIRELKAFRRVLVPPDQSVDVSLSLTCADLRFVGGDMQPIAEPGVFDLWMAPNAQSGLHRTFALKK